MAKFLGSLGLVAALAAAASTPLTESLRDSNAAAGAPRTASANTYQVTNTNDSGAGSLRKAILDANGNPGADTITFAIATGPKTILLASALPTVLGPTTIDATTQPGYAGAPLVEVDGNGQSGPAVLYLLGGSSTVKALVLNNFIGDGIHMGSAGGNTVQGCHIGTNAAGTAAKANTGTGIYVEATAPGNTIGGTTATGNVLSGNASYGLFLGSTGNTVRGNTIGLDRNGTLAVANGQSGIRDDGGGNTIGGASATSRNVVSGNTSTGITLGGPTGTTVQGNTIGTNAAGTAAVPNSGGLTAFSAGNTIGGGAAGEGNVISGNVATGLSLAGGTNVVKGNRIGTDAAGATAIPNAEGINVAGSGNTIGGTAAGEGNLLSGNTSNGISLSGNNNVVAGNLIGTNAAGTAAIPNVGGVTVYGAGNTIGGTVAGAGNLISGNSATGVVLAGGSSGNFVRGNLVGTNAAGTASLGTGGLGIQCNGSANVIGGTTAATRNVVVGATLRAVELGGSGGHTIQGSYVGLNAAGTAALPNAGGITVFSSGNTIGGGVAGAGNVVSGTSSQGIALSGAGATGNSVKGNLVGLNAAGTVLLANTGGGILCEGSSNTIGGATALERNVVASDVICLTLGSGGPNVVKGNYLGTDATGSTALGIGGGVTIYSGGNTIGGAAAGEGNVIAKGLALVDAAATGNVVLGNLIGLNAAGTAAMNAGGIGVRILNANGNTIGGTTAGARNVISGNLRGITLETSSTGNVIQGNSIGTDLLGTSAVPNTEEGIACGAPGNTIGGSAAGAGNVISGQTYYGIWMQQGCTATSVKGNRIGVRADGVTPLPNMFGVLVTSAFGNTVGGTGAGDGNVIAANSYQGIRITSGTANRILGNSIFGHASGAAIDLDPLGVNPNDPFDADTGANLRQNVPLLGSASITGGSTSVTGSLDATPSTSHRVEIFGNTTCHVSGMGEGRTFLGFVTVVTDASGHAPIATTLPTTTPGAFLTATATDPLGNTSELSPCVATTGPNPGRLQFAVDLQNESEAVGSAIVQVTRSGGFAGTVGVHYATSDSGATAGQDYTATSGDLTFGPADFVKTFSVPITLDAIPEALESIQLTLSAPTGGATLGTQSTSKIQILDYDTSLPTLLVSDVSTTEPPSGTSNLAFTVTITPHTGSGSFTVGTVDGSATAGADYLPVTGLVVPFGPTDTSKTINVTVLSDAVAEGIESFFLRISSVTGCTVTKGDGEGTILSPAAGALSIGSVTAGRFPGNATLDDASQSSARQKLLDLGNFGPTGTVPQALSIVDTAATAGSIDATLLSAFKVFYVGSFPDGDPAALTNAELLALQTWVNAGGILVASCEDPSRSAVCQRFGYAMTAGNTNPTTPTAIGAAHPIFSGPFGSVAQLTGGGPGQASFGTLAAGSTLLAGESHSPSRPTLVEKASGTGLVVLLGDADFITSSYAGGLTAGSTITGAADRFLGNAFAYGRQLVLLKGGSVTATAGTPQSAPIGGAFPTSMTATVRDASNAPVPGMIVTFTAPATGPGGSFAGGSPTAVATTNASGVATAATFTANGTAGGPYAVIATAWGVAATASFSLTNTAGAPASITATSGTPQSATIGTAFAALAATVKDAGANPVAGATVTFTAPASGASARFPGAALVATAITNAAGVATAPALTATALAGGPYNVTATVSGVATGAVFALTNLAGPPASIVATAGTPQSAKVSTAFATGLAASVLDSGGNPVAGSTVTFTAPATGASATFPGALLVATAITNAAGLATAPKLIANATIGGPYNVSATVAGVGAAALFSLTNTSATTCVPGDVNGDGLVNLADLFALGNHVYGGAPIPAGCPDVNGDSQVNQADVLFLSSYLLADGPAPQ